MLVWLASLVVCDAGLCHMDYYFHNDVCNVRQLLQITLTDLILVHIFPSDFNPILFLLVIHIGKIILENL